MAAWRSQPLSTTDVTAWSCGAVAEKLSIEGLVQDILHKYLPHERHCCHLGQRHAPWVFNMLNSAGDGVAEMFPRKQVEAPV